jgi:cytoskeletal protein RodZ
MSTVAEQLRAAREARRLTVQQVADATKIRTDHISALEMGNFSVFSAPIYIRGSVKNYATVLKLDLPPLMAALDAELGRTEKFSEPPPFTDESKKPLDRILFVLAKLNLKWALAAGAGAALVAIILLVNFVLQRHHHSDPLTNLPPARYEPSSAGDSLPLPKP